jgi:hypothetical protein
MGGFSGERSCSLEVELQPQSRGPPSFSMRGSPSPEARVTTGRSRSVLDYLMARTCAA